MTPTRVHVLGIPVDASTMDSALERIRSWPRGSGCHLVFAVNPEKVMAARTRPDLRQALEAASLLIPDGIGVVMAARLLDGIRMARVPGSELMPAICGMAAAEGRRVFLFGGKPGVAAMAAELLRQSFPGLGVAGVRDGFAPESRVDEVVSAINSSGADILFVGLGSPRQELWLAEHRQKLAPTICQGVGGTFDVICGNPQRAPKAMRAIHLEWLHRLILQPNRARRQTALPQFTRLVLTELVTRREK